MSFFGKNIRKIRSIKKISQASFAEIFGLSRASVGSYEEGRAEPKIEMIIQIANHFSITIDELINKELTVNDLYHFNLNTEPVFKNKPEAPLFSLTEIPLIMATDLARNSWDQLLKNTTQQITLPISKAGEYAAIYLNDGQITFQPKTLGSTIIIQLDQIKHCQTDLWLLKHENAIFISELIFLANDRILLSSHTKSAYYVNKKDLDYIYPVQLILSDQASQHTSDERISKLELQLNELYKHL